MKIGSGWNPLCLPDARRLDAAAARAAGPGARRRPRPPTPLPDGNVALNAGIRCTPPGGLLRVSVKVRKRAGRPAPRVQRIFFYVRNGPRRTDRHKPYTVRLRLHRPAGPEGPRLRPRVLPPRGLEEAAHQDRVAALRHVLDYGSTRAGR